MFWMLGSGPLPNERRGDVMLVHVRGELEHHKADSYGCAESYEGLREKMAWAYEGQVDGDEDADDAGGPPKAIVMVIDSPGGVVSGLNETVKALQKMAAEHPDVRVMAYCNEMAASAAYALACSCSRILAPENAIVGSIGVISTMVSQARKDQKEGYDVRLLTSGARKADGHPHAPLSDAAVNVEQARVEKLADAFFRLASKARGIPVGKIRNLEAGIFLGKDAKRVGLVDEVTSLDDVIAAASAESSGALPVSGGNKTDRKARMDLKALIRRTEAAIAKEKDPERLSALYATLAGYKKVEKYTKEEETSKEESTEEEESAEEGEEESASAEEDEKKSALPDDEDDDEDGDEDEKKSSKASLAFRAAVESLTGKKGKAAIGAMHAVFRENASALERVKKLEAGQKKSEKASLIASVRGKYCTRADAAWLETQPLSVVRGYVEHAKERGMIVNVDESALVKPKHVEPGTAESLPQERLDAIEAALAGAAEGKAKEDLRKALVAAHLADHNKTIATALNGAGRY